MSCFYVYEHWRLDTDTCFYVGKGKKGRAYARKNRNAHWTSIVKKLERDGYAYEVRFVETGLSEDRAFELEAERIAFWKEYVRLTNLTDGGDGCSGMIHSPESRAKIRENTPVRRGKNHPMFGRKRPDTAIRNKEMSGRPAWNRGGKLTAEHRAKLSEAKAGKPSWNKGKSFSEETKAKMSEAAKNRHNKKPISEETRMKLSEQAKAQWADAKKSGSNKLSVALTDRT